MEVALDFALQCSPDHPWVDEHPEWFTEPRRRHDRLRREPAEEVPGHLPDQLRPRPATASTPRCCASLRHWMDHGVRIFRVDNPHTKPVAFWELADRARSRTTDPDVLFLAEAFTRPAMMHTLAKVGFHQSYTYFTWRNDEVGARGVPHRAVAARPPHFMRPNFFVNTPDILHAYLQYGGPPAFKIRAVLAAHALADLGRLRRLRAVRARRRAAGQRGVPRLREVPAPPARLGGGRGARAAASRRYLTRLNGIRRAHPALQRLRNLRFHRDRQRRR